MDGARRRAEARQARMVLNSLVAANNAVQGDSQALKSWRANLDKLANGN